MGMNRGADAAARRDVLRLRHSVVNTAQDAAAGTGERGIRPPAPFRERVKRRARRARDLRAWGSWTPLPKTWNCFPPPDAR